MIIEYNVGYINYCLGVINGVIWLLSILSFVEGQVTVGITLLILHFGVAFVADKIK